MCNTVGVRLLQSCHTRGRTGTMSTVCMHAHGRHKGCCTNEDNMAPDNSAACERSSPARTGKTIHNAALMACLSIGEHKHASAYRLLSVPSGDFIALLLMLHATNQTLALE